MLDPLLYRWGVPPVVIRCVHWTMQLWVLETWVIAQGPAIVMVINKHKSNKIKENSNTVRHLNNGTDHRHSKSCCDQNSPARRTNTDHTAWASFTNTAGPALTLGHGWLIKSVVFRWDEITHPCPNSNSHRRAWMNYYITTNNGCY